MQQSKITRADLMSLEQYAMARKDFRARALEHKRCRRVGVGPYSTWWFEDRLTVHYQIQEMLRSERIFESDGIQQEIDAYNPLIPDGNNWKVTLFIDIPDIDERRMRLRELKGVEDRCWVQVERSERVWAIADEDLPRENEEKTSAVHFLRFELNADMISKAHAGAAMHIGIDHENYRHTVTPLPQPVRDSLSNDLANL